ncbi:hypothetical protein HHK36_005178 [Tetracentron sinense]|uniref:ER lumen protein-retaining receptor n=1 Tax=Tetracentron sinense TaxID=13715 RepID=A0A834ZP03_TETSI|nr:hypothetical protein HHK36_005178 [Tetracentron sinense]
MFRERRRGKTQRQLFNCHVSFFSFTLYENVSFSCAVQSLLNLEIRLPKSRARNRPNFVSAAMNIFRFAGDMTHLISILVLLLKIYATKSCSGISLKAQELYALVFLTRYMDLFTDFVSVYNTVMKLVFIGSSVAIVWCMRMHRVVKRSYDKELDTFRHYFLIAASFALALLIHEKFTFQEILWAFSIYLEAVAILPQLVLLQRSGNVDNLAGQYVFFLGYCIYPSFA